MPERSVSVVVPCRNEEAHIGRLLAAIGAQAVRPDDIVIVDGGSTDDTLGVISEAAIQLAPIVVRTIVAPDDRLPTAINRAVREARGDVLVRLDGHSSPPPDYIGRAVAHLADPKVGVVGGIWQIVPGDDTPMGEGIARAVSHPLGAGDAAYRIRSARTVTDMDTVPFGCFTRATWQLVGGLNESLLGNEDYEFNYRVRRAGLAVRLDPMMHSTYVARASLGALALQYLPIRLVQDANAASAPDVAQVAADAADRVCGRAAGAGHCCAVYASGRPAARPHRAGVSDGAGHGFRLDLRPRERLESGRRARDGVRDDSPVLGHRCAHFLATSGRWPDRRFLFGQRAAL